MDLRQLRQFVAVAEELSFRRAAQRLHMSQPPLSVSIKRLEDEIGVMLLSRTRHEVRLTVPGEAFLEEARRTLAHAQLSVEIAQRAAAGKLGTLRLSFVPSAAMLVVPGLLRSFRRSSPQVKVILTGETTAQQIAPLVRGANDVGIVVPPLHANEALQVTPLCEQELILAVPHTHALARLRSVQLRDLANQPFVGFPSKDGPGFEGVVMAACQECGFLPDFVQAAPQMNAILALVGAGVGIALVPQSMNVIRLPDVAYLEVRAGHAAVKYSLALAWRPANPNPALAAFLDTVQAAAPSATSRDTVSTAA